MRTHSIEAWKQLLERRNASGGYFLKLPNKYDAFNLSLHKRYGINYKVNTAVMTLNTQTADKTLKFQWWSVLENVGGKVAF